MIPYSKISKHVLKKIKKLSEEILQALGKGVLNDFSANDTKRPPEATLLQCMVGWVLEHNTLLYLRPYHN